MIRGLIAVGNCRGGGQDATCLVALVPQFPVVLWLTFHGAPGSHMTALFLCPARPHFIVELAGLTAAF